jgi:hypothetical protein
MQIKNPSRTYGICVIGVIRVQKRVEMEHG